MIIDTHCHLDDNRYLDDLEDVLTRANSNQVEGFIIPGADITQLKRAQEISQRYENIYYAAGVHPYDIDGYDRDILESHLGDEKCVAVGECGLDYFRLPKDNDEKNDIKEAQKRVFIDQIELAVKYKKPLIVHIRDASADSLEILKKYAANRVVGGVLHCYNASEILLELAQFNFFYGIGGVLTFKNAKKLVEILPQIPQDKLLIETDSPYLTPHPYRGQRNEPSYTTLVAKKMSELLNLSEEQVQDLTTKNAQTLFKLF